MSELCSFIANTIKGASPAVVSTEEEEGWDNAQTVTEEWIILTHLIDVAFYRYQIHTQPDVWKCFIPTAGVAQSFIL